MRLAVILAAALLALALRPAGAVPDRPFGDADCSGAIDAVDALAVLRLEAALETSPCAAVYGNANCWGSAPDAVDALHILRYVAGLDIGWQYEPCPDIGQLAPEPAARAAIVAAAVQWWVGYQGPTAGETLAPVTVDWSTDGACEGYGGCAWIGGCTVANDHYCHAWLCGSCSLTWGNDWMLAVAVHEFGHLLGYTHESPICVMNRDYC